MLSANMSHIVGILLMAVIAAAGWFIWFYNKMTSNKIEVENCREEISVLLIQRFDLMIKLAKIIIISCRGSYGQECLHLLISTNYSFMNMGETERVAESMSRMNKFIEGLLKIIDLYPEIKANIEFMKFQDQLQEIDKKLDVALQHYNSLAQIYNKFLAVFPNNITALILGAKERALFPQEGQGDASPVPLRGH